MSKKWLELTNDDFGEYYDPSRRVGNDLFADRSRMLFLALADIQLDLAKQVKERFVPPLRDGVGGLSALAFVNKFSTEFKDDYMELVRFLVTYRLMDRWAMWLILQAVHIWIEDPNRPALDMGRGIVCGWPKGVLEVGRSGELSVEIRRSSIKWSPLVETKGRFEKRVRLADSSTLKDAINQVTQDVKAAMKWKKRPELRDWETERRHHAWLVSYQCAKRSYEEIVSSEAAAGRTFTIDAVKKACMRLRECMDLTLRGGKEPSYVERALALLEKQRATDVPGDTGF